MGGELGDVLIAPNTMECDDGRGVRGCTYRSKYNEVCVWEGC